MSTAETTSQITDQREVTINRMGGAVTWQVTEFDYGRSYMLSVRSAGSIGFDAHFDGEQFRSLQAMLVHGYEGES